MRRFSPLSRLVIWLLAAMLVGGLVTMCLSPVHRALADSIGPADEGAQQAVAEEGAAQATSGKTSEAKPVEVKPPADEMTMFRGNMERSLSGVGKVPRKPKLLWRFRTRTKFEGASERRGSKVLTPASTWTGLGWTGQPCFIDGNLYYGSADSYVYAHDAKTGKLHWYYPNHHCIKGSITIADGFIYHGGRDNKIHCYTLAGKMAWETRTGNDMDSNPAVIGNRGFIGGEDNYLYCFSPQSGEILWRFGPTDGSIESSPCVANDRVYAGSGHGYLYCVEAGTGKLVWKFKTLGDTDSSPVYYGGCIFVANATGDSAETGHVWCLDAKKGTVLWHKATPRGVWATVALNTKLKRVYVGCNDGVLYALQMGNGKELWQKKLGNRIWGSPVVADGCILVPTRDGRLWCLDEKAGKPIWAFDDGFDIDATPCVAGGMIFIGSQNGWVYAIGNAGAGENVNSHWFATSFPIKRRPDHNTAGIKTISNPAPAPKEWGDTSANYRAGIYKPVFGPGAK